MTKLDKRKFCRTCHNHPDAPFRRWIEEDDELIKEFACGCEYGLYASGMRSEAVLTPGSVLQEIMAGRWYSLKDAE